MGKNSTSLPNFQVSRAGQPNSGAIPAPAGHQFYDLRWMRDPKYLKSYAEYWLAGPPFSQNATPE
jgi:hypothetical protein